MSHWSLRACGSHGTTTSWIPFHPLQEKIGGLCVGSSKWCVSVDGCVCTTGASPACLSFLVGLWVLYFLRFQVPPLGPFHPAQKKKNLNPNLSSGKSVLCYLDIFLVLLSVQAFLGNPSHPVEREEQMGCGACTCTAQIAALQLIKSPTLSPLAPLSPRSPREPWRANESV